MRKKIIGAILAIFLLAAGYVSYQLWKPAVSNPGNRFFYIQEGETLAGIESRLRNDKMLDGGGFGWACRLLRFSNPKPGRYLLRDGMSAYKLVRLLRSGEQALVRVTLVKERTKELFASKMGTGKKFDFTFDSLQMITFLNHPDSVRLFGADTSNIMAFVIPDTYFHKWNSSPGKLMQQLYAAYKKFWNPDRVAKVATQGLSPLQAMILASIVEEETNRKDDKLKVASVYINRLRQGMRLQADPTVKFITRNFQLGRITGAHLKLESPYNTYLHEGLPPGPICTPSISSIEAVVNAPQTDYLFFVASYKFDGSSIFTSNLTDHNKYARMFHTEQNRRADSIRKLKAKQPGP